jgi:hypothetical protein
MGEVPVLKFDNETIERIFEIVENPTEPTQALIDFLKSAPDGMAQARPETND